jgi:hypothetical protein
MAAPFVNFLQAPLQESAFKELGNLVNRYQGSQLRGQEQQLNQEKLRQLQMPDMGHYAKLIQSAEQAKKMYPNYAADIDQALQNEFAGKQGISASFNSDTGAFEFNFGGPSGQGGANANAPVVSEGAIRSMPTGATQSQIQQMGRANVLRELYEPIKMPFIGEGSNLALREARNLYKQSGDEQAGEQLVQAALAYKLLPEMAISQLAAQGITSPTQTAIEHQKEAIMQGWPELGNLQINNLPKELQERVNELYSEKLDEATEAENEFIAAGHPIKLPNKELSQAAKSLGVTMSQVKASAKRRGISEEEVIEKLKKYQGGE